MQSRVSYVTWHLHVAVWFMQCRVTVTHILQYVCDNRYVRYQCSRLCRVLTYSVAAPLKLYGIIICDVNTCSMSEESRLCHVLFHRGMSPAAAELMYIKLAQQLPEYGHEVYQALVTTSTL